MFVEFVTEMDAIVLQYRHTRMPAFYGSPIMSDDLIWL